MYVRTYVRTYVRMYYVHNMCTCCSINCYLCIYADIGQEIEIGGRYR